MAYNVIKPTKIITDGDMGGNITSQVLDILNQDNVSLQLVWTGTPTGTFEFQASNTYRINVTTNAVEHPGDWVPLTVSPSIAAAGAPGTAMANLNQQSSAFIRVVYTRGSGAGTLQCVVVAKGI